MRVGSKCPAGYVSTNKPSIFNSSPVLSDKWMLLIHPCSHKNRFYEIEDSTGLSTYKSISRRFQFMLRADDYRKRSDFSTGVLGIRLIYSLRL